MSTKKMLIVGNNQEFIAEISTLVQSNFKNEIKIVASANSVKSVINILKKIKPDLLLIDFCLCDGTAIDILSLTNHNSKENSILFLKNKDENLEKLLAVNSYNYFVKPIDINNFIGLISDMLKKETNSKEKIQDKENFEPVHGSCMRNKIFINVCKGTNVLDVFKIIRCEVNDNCLSFIMSDKKEFKCVNTLVWAENILSGSDCTFLRVHNKHLINVDYISSYSNNNHCKVEMNDGSIVPVSSRRKILLLKFLKNQVNFIKSILIIITSHLLLLFSDQLLGLSHI